MVILNRRIVVGKEGYLYEPDGKHALKVLRELGLDGKDCKGSLMPGSKVKDDELMSRPLSETTARWFRPMAATANYMAMDGHISALWPRSSAVEWHP